MKRPQFSLKSLLWLMAVVGVMCWPISLMPTNLRLMVLGAMTVSIVWIVLGVCIGVLMGLVICLAVFCFDACRRLVKRR